MSNESYKKALEEEHAVLIQELQRLGVQNPHHKADWVTAQQDPANTADPNDVADRTEEYDTKRATLAHLETRFNNIERALGHIEAGTYGRCVVCGQAIETPRLQANPAAPTCMVHINEATQS